MKEWFDLFFNHELDRETEEDENLLNENDFLKFLILIVKYETQVSTDIRLDFIVHLNYLIDPLKPLFKARIEDALDPEINWHARKQCIMFFQNSGNAVLGNAVLDEAIIREIVLCL